MPSFVIKTLELTTQDCLNRSERDQRSLLAKAAAKLEALLTKSWQFHPVKINQSQYNCTNTISPHMLANSYFLCHFPGNVFLGNVFQENDCGKRPFWESDFRKRIFEKRLTGKVTFQETNDCKPFFRVFTWFWVIWCRYIRNLTIVYFCDMSPLQTYLPNIRVHAYFAPLTPTPSVGGGRRRYCRCCSILWRCVVIMQHKSRVTSCVPTLMLMLHTGLLHWISLILFKLVIAFLYRLLLSCQNCFASNIVPWWCRY